MVALFYKKYINQKSVFTKQIKRSNGRISLSIESGVRFSRNRMQIPLPLQNKCSKKRQTKNKNEKKISSI